MNTELIRSLVDLLAFLELSDSRVVDTDSAVQAMETVARNLQRLSSPDREEFLQAVARMAQETIDDRKRAFLMRMPEDLGLTEVQ